MLEVGRVYQYVRSSSLRGCQVKIVAPHERHKEAYRTEFVYCTPGNERWLSNDYDMSWEWGDRLEPITSPYMELFL